MFSALYKRVLTWSRRPDAVKYLAALSFAESSFFPIPPDVMLAPMSLAQPGRAIRFALITTLASIAGGVLGYLIGYFSFDVVSPWIERFGYTEAYNTCKAWFRAWGFWAVLVAGFTPIPYKIFTITAGALAMPFLPFVAASFIGRSARFFLVALLVAWGGERLESALHAYVNRIGWGVVVIAIIVVAVIRFSAGG